MIEMQDVCVHAGEFRLDCLSLRIPTGSYAVLMGKTGCGKTTLIEALCGLRRVAAGRILLTGRDVTVLKPAERGVGYVPQDAALFSTMTVKEHLAFALRIRKRPQSEIDTRVELLAERLEISGLLSRYPQGLSGGEAQRVALGRALSFSPEILLLDEPLSALDRDTREDMCAMLASVQRDTGVTVLHITHDAVEAKRLAQHIFRLENGAIIDAEGAITRSFDRRSELEAGRSNE